MTQSHWRDSHDAAAAIATLSAESGTLPELGFGRVEDLVPQAFASFRHSYKSGSGYSFRMDSVVRRAIDEGEFIGGVKEILAAPATLVSWRAGSHDLPILALDAMRHKRFAGPSLAAAQGAFAYQHVELHEMLMAEAGAFQENVCLAARSIGIEATTVGAGDVRRLLKDDPEQLRVMAERQALTVYLVWLYWRAYDRADGRLFGYPTEALSHWIETNEAFRGRHQTLCDWIVAQDFEAFAEGERDREAVGYPQTRG